MNLKLKICGLRDAENIREISALQPDFQGFIYYAKSPRFVGDSLVAPSTTSKRVGVFVNEASENIIMLVKRDKLDLVQLHGGEPPALAKALVEAGVSVMKVFSVDKDFDFNSLKAFIPYSQYFLFDTKTQGYGGSGKTFDWILLNQYNYSTPFFLSGGLAPENIRGVAQIKNPAFYGVDVNSGVEDSPGIKNINKVRELINILKTI
jgi:phosphoribosylanthranilate isomerase